MSASNDQRLSVSVIDVFAGRESEFHAVMREYGAAMERKGYGRSEIIQDEAAPLRFYAVRIWSSAASAERSHADAQIQALTSRLLGIARVTHVVNGARKAEAIRLILAERRAHIEVDRRTGFDRRLKDVGRKDGDRRAGRDRRLGPRRVRNRDSAVELVAAARRARQHADAAYSNFKVGAALETVDGTVVTGCNIENATYGLTICAERVAMFKALSEGHRAFTRIAIVADTDEPTPPCGACRQILWEFGGNLEVRLANLTTEAGGYWLKDLLPLPFDARLL